MVGWKLKDMKEVYLLRNVGKDAHFWHPADALVMFDQGVLHLVRAYAAEPTDLINFDMLLVFQSSILNDSS